MSSRVPRHLEQHPRRGREHPSMVIETLELGRIAAQRILAFGHRHCVFSRYKK